MDSPYRLSIEDSPAPADLNFVSDRLREYNSNAAGPSGFQRIASFLRDEEGEIVGGLIAGLYWGWLHLDVLWVREDLRKLGYGSELLRAVEAEALSRGFRKAYLDTFSYQALGFYQRHGYTVFGQLDDIPDGHTQYYLSKLLTD
jgi:GNAT superfamily N-acetyltransferase